MKEYIEKAVRHALTAVFGFLAIKGIALDPSVTEPFISSSIDLLVGVGGYLIVQVWSWARAKVPFIG